MPKQNRSKVKQKGKMEKEDMQTAENKVQKF